MLISTLWITRTYSDAPEMIEAWSEFDIDANYEGWEAAWKKGLDSIGSDLLEHRTIDLEVPYADIQRAFDSPTVKAAVVPDERNAE